MWVLAQEYDKRNLSSCCSCHAIRLLTHIHTESSTFTKRKERRWKKQGLGLNKNHFRFYWFSFLPREFDYIFFRQKYLKIRAADCHWVRNIDIKVSGCERKNSSCWRWNKILLNASGKHFRLCLVGNFIHNKVIRCPWICIHGELADWCLWKFYHSPFQKLMNLSIIWACLRINKTQKVRLGKRRASDELRVIGKKSKLQGCLMIQIDEEIFDTKDWWVPVWKIKQKM